MRLEWNPQVSFADYFYTTVEDILKYRSVFREEITYFVPYGGRGSGKTFTFADAVVIEGTLRKVRILVTRELQLSIEESIKAEIEAAIVERGLEHFYTIQKTVIIGKNGTRFIFKGLKNNIGSLKSISDVDIVLCEESENISNNSWTKFLPSIRPRDKVTRGGEEIVIVIYNPDDELDDTHQRFVVNPPARCVSRLINWRDNKYFPANLERQRQDCKRLRPPDEYENVWEGKCKGGDDNQIIQLEWIKAARFASRNPDFVKTGSRRFAYDPAGQGKDSNAGVAKDGNIINYIDEWLRSKDLRVATKRAFNAALGFGAEQFSYDTCGGYGDGVSVFVDDIMAQHRIEFAQEYNIHADVIKIHPFDAGAGVINPDKKIPGTKKTWGEQYGNAKAQAQAVTANLLYTTYRFIVNGDRDMKPDELLSIDIDDDDVFNKLCKELKTPLWVKSNVNSKKVVESKEDMEKRTGLKSPNIGDAIHMVNAPTKAVFIPTAG